MKKILSILLITVMILTLGTSFAFAATSDPSQSVPAHITVAVTPINVTVPEAITMNAAANSAELTISSYKIENKSAIGVIEVTSLNVTQANGWSLVEDTTAFITLPANSKKFSFKYGEHDFATAATKDLSSGNTANPGSSVSFDFTGKTGIVTNALNGVQVATVVATLGYQ